MKLPLFTSVAALGLLTAIGAMAQEAPPPPNDMGDAQMPQTPPATPPSPSTSPPPAPDPNAGQPTGEVPPTTGMTAAPAGTPQDPSAPVGSSANPVTVGGNATPPPAAQTDYPLCSKAVQDSCINPGEAKKSRKRR